MECEEEELLEESESVSEGGLAEVGVSEEEKCDEGEVECNEEWVQIDSRVLALSESLSPSSFLE